MQPQYPPVPDPAVPPVPAATAAAAPAIADDGDLIEKDWVLKIKQLLQATANDPRVQSQEFSKLKADYMQKRYGKIIKAAE